MPMQCTTTPLVRAKARTASTNPSVDWMRPDVGRPSVRKKIVSAPTLGDLAPTPAVASAKAADRASMSVPRAPRRAPGDGRARELVGAREPSVEAPHDVVEQHDDFAPSSSAPTVEVTSRVDLA